MLLAYSVATRATCDRKHVGAVIVKDKQVLSTGYNGSPMGLPECDEVGHELVDMGGRQSCIRSVHAECNAVTLAARHGTAINGSTVYTTASPCYDCFKMLVNAGVTRIVCGEEYAGRYGAYQKVMDLAKSLKISVKYVKVDFRNFLG